MSTDGATARKAGGERDREATDTTAVLMSREKEERLGNVESGGSGGILLHLVECSKPPKENKSSAIFLPAARDEGEEDVGGGSVANKQHTDGCGWMPPCHSLFETTNALSSFSSSSPLW